MRFSRRRRGSWGRCFYGIDGRSLFSRDGICRRVDSAGRLGRCGRAIAPKILASGTFSVRFAISVLACMGERVVTFLASIIVRVSSALAAERLSADGVVGRVFCSRRGMSCSCAIGFLMPIVLTPSKRGFSRSLSTFGGASRSELRGPHTPFMEMAILVVKGLVERHFPPAPWAGGRSRSGPVKHGAAPSKRSRDGMGPRYAAAKENPCVHFAANIAIVALRAGAADSLSGRIGGMGDPLLIARGGYSAFFAGTAAIKKTVSHVTRSTASKILVRNRSSRRGGILGGGRGEVPSSPSETWFRNPAN